MASACTAGSLMSLIFPKTLSIRSQTMAATLALHPPAPAPPDTEAWLNSSPAQLPSPNNNKQQGCIQKLEPGGKQDFQKKNFLFFWGGGGGKGV